MMQKMDWMFNEFLALYGLITLDKRNPTPIKLTMEVDTKSFPTVQVNTEHSHFSPNVNSPIQESTPTFVVSQILNENTTIPPFVQTQAKKLPNIQEFIPAVFNNPLQEEPDCFQNFSRGT
ncbi:hypothetical protein O6P43_024079 [Quillaja saponaria]|uniref:Uncharacterized protein n=1 Tax=Quillaja saponaria TaxID=32244 RepID=A0AAD7PET6_QUISA|nr:hypothetical protein O6P43_024079 [Quillaja saponaria]